METTIGKKSKPKANRNQFNLRFYLGNAFIVLSLAVLFFTYYPFINLYLNPPKINANLNAKGYFIQIPKISAQAPIILDVNQWDPKEYRQKLKKGVAHAKNTSLPGEKGTSFLFAHSSGPPWEISRYNTVFFRLGELKKGDEIIIVKDGKKLKYKVREKKEVWPTEISFLKDLTRNQLILQTCTPIGTDLKRLLIFADPD